MCGRFAMSIDFQGLMEEFPWLNPPDDFPPRYNIAPSQPIAVVVNDGCNKVEFFRWGLVPHWAKDPAIGNRMINARAETLAEKPSFRVAFRRRRCLIFSSGWYEWGKPGAGGEKKTPYFIRLKPPRPFAFAGLWETWSPKEPGAEPLRTCTIVTCPPNEMISRFHHRMPVVLPPEGIELWLDPCERNPEELQHLLAPFPEEKMEAFPVSTKVNNPRNDSPECTAPAD